MSNFIEKLLDSHPLNKIERMLTGRNEMATEAKKKADQILASKDSDGNLLYPNAKKDLLTHYFLSQDMSEQTNIPLSLALGFAKEGEGYKLYENKDTYFDGRIPINTSGGLKACGHPVGATGIKQAIEATMQLRGTAKDRQVKNAEIGVTHNVGGSGATAAVHVFKKVK